MENIGKVYLKSILLCIITSAAFSESGDFKFLFKIIYQQFEVLFRKDGDIFKHMGLLPYCWHYFYYCLGFITARVLKTVNRLANSTTTFPDALLSTCTKYPVYLMCGIDFFSPNISYTNAVSRGRR